MPVLSSSSLSRNELAVDESERSVTCPTFIGRPANSKPFNCSKAFFAHSASANLRSRGNPIIGISIYNLSEDRRASKKDDLITDMKPYPLDLPVSLSIISWIPSIFKKQNLIWSNAYTPPLKIDNNLKVEFLTFPKGSKIPRSISSVMLKCRDPT